MERFPTLRLILRFGGVGAIVIAILAGVGIAGLIWPVWGWPAIPAGFVVAVFVYIFVKSYVEVVSIVTEMVH